jgi:chemotaxis protein MotA
MKKGVTGLVDGTNELLLERAMQQETKLLQGRHENGADMLAAGAELAPGMGMIGTLIGLVNLLANLDDPSTIGPNMAIALLTTLYGSVLANVFFIPMGMKLEGYTKREVNNNDLILAGIMFVKAGKNPRLLPEFLGAYTLPKDQRKREAEAAE